MVAGKKLKPLWASEEGKRRPAAWTALKIRVACLRALAVEGWTVGDDAWPCEVNVMIVARMRMKVIIGPRRS